MKVTGAPQIGFDRFIDLNWASSALRVRAGSSELQELLDLLDATHSGLAAKKKTRTVLNRLWLEPRPDLIRFAERGVRLYRDAPDTPMLALSWAMAITVYPFFGRVAEIIGRLTSLQGYCTSVEIHRRMSEAYGEREGTRRMTNMVLQTQASWGAIERAEKGKRLIRRPKLSISEPNVVAWLVEACVRYARRPLVVAAIDSDPVAYPFNFGNALSYVLSNSVELELRPDGTGNQVVDIKGYS